MDVGMVKRVSRRLVLELIVVVAASFHAGLPTGDSYLRTWQSVGRHPLLVIHVAVGVVILVEAVVFVLRCMRAGQHRWAVLALIGLAFVLLAFAAGERSVATGRTSAIDVMGVAWFAALVAYAMGWYLGRRTRPAIHRPSR
jgi:CDP-diglyceride synthetase